MKKQYTNKEFIVDLLNQKGVSLHDRDRLLALCAKELDNVDKTLLDREESLNIREKELKIADKTLLYRNQNNGNECNKHDPLFIVKRLRKFTEKGYLKYTTHIWDRNTDNDGFEYDGYDDFVSKYKRDFERSEFKKITDLYNKHLGLMLYNFLCESEKEFKWGKYDIRLGYCYPNGYMKKWMDANPTQQPFAMPLDKFPQEYIPKEPIRGKTMLYFEDIVNIFKDSIEFRNNALYFLVKGLTRNSDYKVDDDKLETLRGKTFYTDTWQVEQALNIMFSNIRNRSEFPNVEIMAELSNDNTYIELDILHIDSFSDKPLNDDKINLLGGKGELFKIKNLLQSLCDWSIESRFEDTETHERKFYKIDYLNKNRNNFYADPEIRPITECRGFKHILKFYL